MEHASDLLVDHGELPREAGSKWDSLWGWPLEVANLGNSFYHVDTEAGNILESSL